MIAERDGGSWSNGTAAPAVSELELWLLLEAVHRQSGYDFRGYAPATLKRRVAERVRAENVRTITGLAERVLHEPDAMTRFIEALTYNANSPFREPAFFASFVERVLPRLRTFPVARLWIAGCAGGEDAYALAILLDEAGMLDRTRIYATDASDVVIERARAGTFPAPLLDEYQTRYERAGGARSLESYVTIDGGVASFVPRVRERIVFAQHNLATDGSFNEFHLIVARGVLNQFSRVLAYRAHQVIFESLVRLGYLALSSSESLRYSPHQRAYDVVEGTETFFRRLR